MEHALLRPSLKPSLNQNLLLPVLPARKFYVELLSRVLKSERKFWKETLEGPSLDIASAFLL